MRKIFLIYALLAFITLQYASAQQTAINVQPDTTGTLLSSKLGISRSKGKQLVMAYNYKRDEIAGLIRNTSLDPSIRQEALKRLLDERRVQLNMVLSRGLKDTIGRQLGDLIILAEQKKKAQDERFQLMLNKQDQARMNSQPPKSQN